MRVTHLQGQPHKNTGARLTTVPFINVFIKISLAEIFYRFQLLEIGLEKSAWRWCFVLFQVARRGAGAQEPSVIAAKGFGYSNGSHLDAVGHQLCCSHLHAWRRSSLSAFCWLSVNGPVLSGLKCLCLCSPVRFTLLRLNQSFVGAET